MPTGRTILIAFVVCSLMASIAGFYLAAEVQIGSPIIGNQALESIAAAVLGGASLSGGKGSFFGTLLAALFLTEIDNVLPLFQQPTEYADMTIGVLILLALVLYQAPELSRASAPRGSGRTARAAPSAPSVVVPRGSAARPMTTQTACTGSPPIAQSRCGDDESKAIDAPAPSSYSSKPTRTPSVPLVT